MKHASRSDKICTSDIEYKYTWTSYNIYIFSHTDSFTYTHLCCISCSYCIRRLEGKFCFSDSFPFSSLTLPFSSSSSSSSAMYKEERSRANVQWKTRIANVSDLERKRREGGREGGRRRTLELENAVSIVYSPFQ